MVEEPRPPAVDPDWHIGRLLTAAARMLEQAFDADVAELGITHAGFRVLDALTDDPLPQHVLAVRCQVQAQTLSRIVDGLERDGYVVRQRDDRDRRRVLVRQTTAGEELLERARQLASPRLDLFSGSGSDSGSGDEAACRRVLVQIIKRLGHERWGC
jgi:MarR family transcriptional regulator, organic hydroperoxide resistance regulator